MLLERTTTTSFQSWTKTVRAARLDPHVVVLGTRGKTTVVKLIEAIASDAGLRVASRTDSEVQILGRTQAGYLRPWQSALRKLTTGDLDLLIEEVDWDSIPLLMATGARPAAIVVTTVCPDRDFCRLVETKRSLASLQSFIESVSPDTLAVIDADDVAFPTLADRATDHVAISAIRREHPSLQRFIVGGGVGAWVEDGWLVTGSAHDSTQLVPLDEAPIAINGSALFQVHNLMAATLLATQLGLADESIRRALCGFEPTPASMPTSLSVISRGQARVLVDRPNDPTFLGPVLRTVRSMKPDRLICVLDYPQSADGEDLVEIGKMLSRVASICVLIDEDAGLRGVLALRAGIAQTEHPSPILHAPTLAKAIYRGQQAARPNDIVLILSHRPHLVQRALDRTVLSSSAA